MKLLSLFLSGAGGPSGAALQQQGFAAGPPMNCEVGQVGHDRVGQDSFGPTGPTCEKMSGPGESVDTTGSPHRPHWPHSENGMETIIGDCSKQQRLTCAGHPEHCIPGCVHAVPYYTAPNGEVYFIRRVKAEKNIEPRQQHPEPEVDVCTRAQGRLLQ